jgi:hypothetical protein
MKTKPSKAWRVKHTTDWLNFRRLGSIVSGLAEVWHRPETLPGIFALTVEQDWLEVAWLLKWRSLYGLARSGRGSTSLRHRGWKDAAHMKVDIRTRCIRNRSRCPRNVPSQKAIASDTVRGTLAQFTTASTATTERRLRQLDLNWSATGHPVPYFHNLAKLHSPLL